MTPSTYIYWVLNLLWKGYVLAWGLRDFFNKRHFRIRVEPLHPDGVCGFRPIGNIASRLNVILFLLGLYLSLKVIDKIVIQQSSLVEDIGNPMMLCGYAILAPRSFFLPLGAAHNTMLEAKEDSCGLSASGARSSSADFKSLQAFFGTVVVPLLPVILPILIQLIIGVTAQETSIR